MAKKSFFEKFGLVESVAASEYEMPSVTRIDYSGQVECPTIQGDLAVAGPVQAEVPEGDTIDIGAVYDANGMNPADTVTVYKIKDVIDTFPSEMPTKTKRATVTEICCTRDYL